MYLQSEFKVVYLLFLCVTVAYGSSLREYRTTTLEPEALLDEAEATTTGSRVKRQAQGLEDNEILPTVPADQDQAEVVTQKFQDDAFLETTIAYRNKREAEATEVSQGDDLPETTIAYRSKREADVTEVPQGDDLSETTITYRKKREADVTEVSQGDDLSETTIAYRKKREADVTEVPQGDDLSETTIESLTRDEVTESLQSNEVVGSKFLHRTKRGAEVTETPVADEASGSTLESIARDEVVTDVTQSDEGLVPTLISRSKRGAEVTEIPQADEESRSTINSISRDEVVTEVTQSDEGDLPTSSRVKREAEVTEVPQADESSGSTLESVARDAVTETAQSDEVASTLLSRTKRETVELATESIASNEILNDATEVPANFFGEKLGSKNVDEDFKYPTTPYPDTENASVLPEETIEDISHTIIKDMTVQNIISGNLSCKCGTPLTRIVGGEPAKISELPWTVALIRKSNKTRSGPYCGGTLVSDRYIVTASHCVDGFEAKKIEVWLNEEDFRVDDENLSGTLRIDVEEIIMHPEYNRRSIDNDIALLKLAVPVDIEKAIRPVCLPSDNTKSYENEDGIVAGWGAKEQGGSVSATLQKVSVPILSNKVCNWRTLYVGKITDNQLCAGELTTGGKDSCQGDSGGPLVVTRGGNSKSQFVLAGVVSYGFGCAKPFAPGVYTRLSQYPAWIMENSQDALYCAE